MQAVKQIYTKCLAQGAYFISNGKEAVVIDPLREVEQYVELAKAKGVEIKYIFETHLHADFVSGHLTLSKKTGAPIVFGPGAKPEFDAHIAKDGEVFKVGDLRLKAIHTPGHTPESTCFLLLDASDTQHALFTGDTLFIGDVGRPDLAQENTGLTSRDLAGMLYDSLHQKIMPLDDHIIIYPAHGKGSACGKNMSSETSDTLKNQKAENYALSTTLSREEFIDKLTTDLEAPPMYFKDNVRLNTTGYMHVDRLLEKTQSKALSIEVFKEKLSDPDTVLLDVRHQDDFVKGYIPGAIFVGLNGKFAPWVGTLLKEVKTPILFISPAGREEETITRLARVGFDHVLGYLSGGMDTWKKHHEKEEKIDQISADQIKDTIREPKNKIVDVRKPSEYALQHLKESMPISLSTLSDQISKFDNKQQYFLHCGGGYRSVIAASILIKEGISNVIDIKGGFGAIAKQKELHFEFG